jgi:hypothetical protein
MEVLTCASATAEGKHEHAQTGCLILASRVMGSNSCPQGHEGFGVCAMWALRQCDAGGTIQVERRAENPKTERRFRTWSALARALTSSLNSLRKPALRLRGHDPVPAKGCARSGSGFTSRYGADPVLTEYFTTRKNILDCGSRREHPSASRRCGAVAAVWRGPASGARSVRWKFASRAACNAACARHERDPTHSVLP